MSRHRHKVAAAERDQRRRDVQAKLAAAAGVDVSDPRCEALSWLLLSLDVAKERLLSGVFVDLSAWQALVDQMQALLPKPPQNTLNIRWTESIGHCAKCKAVSTAEEYAAYEALLDRRVDDEVTKRLQAIPQPVAKVEQSAPTPAAESPATPTHCRLATSHPCARARRWARALMSLRSTTPPSVLRRSIRRAAQHDRTTMADASTSSR